jgi:hypothetical protein
MSKEQTKALAIVGGDYAALSCPKQEIEEAITVNLGGSVNEFMLDRVGVPAGGATSWQVPSLEGVEASKTIEGIIVAIKHPRTYWKTSFDETGGGTPPDCYSDDGVLGVGAPGGNCTACPLSKFGSSDKGPGQACRENAMLFMLRADDFLPIVVKAPPSSLKALGQYTVRLASKRKPYYSVVTCLKLEEAKNKKGIKYSSIVPEMVGLLGDAELSRVRSYADSIKSFVARSSKEVFDDGADSE